MEISRALASFANAFYIQSNFDWICYDRNRGCVYVCACVRASVCLCVSALQPKRLNRFQWNFAQMVSRINTLYVFLGFWNFEFGDVTAAILYFFVPALSRSQFCFDRLQNYRQETLLSSNVCYWKSAKSVNNFRSKKRTAFEKNRLFGFQAGVGGPWFESRRGQIFFNLIFVVMFSNDSNYTKKNQI